MRVSEPFFGDEVSLETIVRHCASDRNNLIRRIRQKYDGLEKKLPAELLADIIFDVCHWTIVERDLPYGQHAYSDFANRKIRISKQLDRMARDEDCNPLAYRRQALGHELAHLRLHPDEITSLDYRSCLGSDQGYDDPRYYQKEREAEAYAAIFLVPLKLLRATEQAAELEEAIRARAALKTSEIWGLIHPLAARFMVTPATMARALACHGYLAPIPYPVPRRWIPVLGDGIPYEIEEDYENEDSDEEPAM